MKLLLDHNLSHRLLDMLQAEFPDSTQVRLIGLAQASDRDIWEFAKANDFVLVTKDSDFYEFALLNGVPPKVVWLKCGNTSTAHIERLLIENQSAIKAFVEQSPDLCLEIY